MPVIRPPLLRPCPPPPRDEFGSPSVDEVSWCVVLTGKPRPVDSFEPARGKRHNAG